jgi:hypothetical protein
VSSRFQNLCLAVGLWNERAPILKERLFGLTGSEGNHGEDVKEYYFCLDSMPINRVWVDDPEPSSRLSRAGRPVLYAVFIDPQLGRVGLTEKEARVQGVDYRVAKSPMTWVARALETDETRGLMKAIVDAKTGQILGAAILDIEGGEVMTVLQMAMMGGVPYTAIRDGVFAHPTLAEALNNLLIAMQR